MNKNILKNQKGNAIFLVLVIMSGMLVVGLGLGNLILTNIKMGGVQTQSTKAYFAAEAGAEFILYEYRKNSYTPPYPNNNSIASSTLSNGSSYNVSYSEGSDGGYDFKDFVSIGSFGNVRRSVETSLRYYNGS
ncbi:pilus assembly PilX N-terminal domain-containing protein [bacterium]|nr:pilus assembly PilX N-terminal domain-containing protein [bacterium]